MSTNVDKYFTCDRNRLSDRQKDISAPIADLAARMNEALPDGAEKSAGMRKLLEARDCFMRAAEGD